MRPQAAHILRELRRVGDLGLTYNYLRQGGERYIADPAKRVSELRAEGYEIEVVPERTPSGSVTRRVFLRSEPASELDPGTSRGDGDSSAKGQPRVDLGGTSPSQGPPESPEKSLSAPVDQLFSSDEFKQRPKHDQELAA